MARQRSLFRPILSHSISQTKLWFSILPARWWLRQCPLPHQISILWLPSSCYGHWLNWILVFCIQHLRLHRLPLHKRRLQRPQCHLHQFHLPLSSYGISSMLRPAWVSAMRYHINQPLNCTESAQTSSPMLMTNCSLISASLQVIQSA